MAGQMRARRLSEILPASGLVLSLLPGCSGPQVAAPQMDEELAATIAEVMAARSPYTLEAEEGSGGETWYEAEFMAEAEVYFAPDGSMPKFEVEIPWDVMPAAVQEASRAELQVGDTLEAAELVYLNGRLYFEVEIVNAAGEDRDLYYTPEGELVPGLSDSTD